MRARRTTDHATDSPTASKIVPDSHMTLRRAIQVYPRPWIDGSVTFQEWLLATTVLLDAIEHSEGRGATPSISGAQEER